MAGSQEGKGQAEEQKHDRGRVEGEDGCAAAEGREQLKEVSFFLIQCRTISFATFPSK